MASSSHSRNPQEPEIINLVRPNPTAALERANRGIGYDETAFAMSMKKSFVEDDCRLTMPFDHCESHLKEFKNRPIQLVYDSKKWDCMLKFSNNKYRLGAGWRDFVIATGLKKHDAVKFNMIYGSMTATVYNVSIFKA